MQDGGCRVRVRESEIPPAHVQFDYRAVFGRQAEKPRADSPVPNARRVIKVPVADAKYSEQPPGLLVLEKLEPGVKLALALLAKQSPQHRVGQLAFVQHVARLSVFDGERAQLPLKRARRRLLREQLLAHSEVVA